MWHLSILKSVLVVAEQKYVYIFFIAYENTINSGCPTCKTMVKYGLTEYSTQTENFFFHISRNPR